jgi:hypothetical protein
MMQMLVRFLIGGAVVSVFAALADVLRPKSFAGILGAAPSIALATLALTVRSRGAVYASIEARSMIIGAVALLVYACVSCRVLWSGRSSAVRVTLCTLPVWFLAAILGWLAVLRHP